MNNNYESNFEDTINSVVETVNNLYSQFPNKRIEMIKELRAKYGFTLKKAKDIVEAKIEIESENLKGFSYPSYKYSIQQALIDPDRNISVAIDKRCLENGFCIDNSKNNNHKVHVSIGNGSKILIYDADNLDEARRVQVLLNHIQGFYVEEQEIKIWQVVE